MPIDPIDILCILLVLSGLVFFLGASVGLLRFPDFYARMHAAGKGDTLSTLLIMAGAGLYELQHFGAEDGSALSAVLIVAKIIAIGIFIMVTSPTSTHALMQAGYEDGIEPDGHAGELRMEIPELGRSVAVPAAATAATAATAPEPAKKSPARKKTVATKKKASSVKRAAVKKVAKKVPSKKAAKKVAAAGSAVAKKKKKVAAKKIVKETKKAVAEDLQGTKKKSAAKRARTKNPVRKPKKKAAPTKKTPRREGGD